MILRYLSVLGDAPAAFFILFAAFSASILMGLVFHEFCHALVADRLGDRTPRLLGRLTLDPRAHWHPIGTLLIFIVGFGFAKPVPVNPFNTRNPKQSMALIASAGPVSNLLVAGLASLPIRFGWLPFFHPFIAPGSVETAARLWTESPENLAGLFLGTIVLLNVLLAVFNFIPLAPLDGYQIAVGLLPRGLSIEYQRLAPWMPGVLLLLFFLPFITNGEFSPLVDLMGPPINFFLELFVGGSTRLRVA